MIYRIDKTGYDEYKILSKPFKLWPWWKYITTVFDKEMLHRKITMLKLNPVYEGTVDQIFEQTKNFKRRETGAIPPG